MDDPIARGTLPQPPWTVRQIHELRDLDDAGRRLRGPAGGSRHRNAMDARLYLLPMLQAKADAVTVGYKRRAHKRLPPEEIPRAYVDP